MLTEFLLARITEDETIAQAAASEEGPCWVYDRRSAHLIGAFPENPNFVGGLGMVGKVLVGEHAAHFDAHRMLAECDAKRRIVEDWGPFDTYNGEDLLAVLAMPYADHPDYRPAWAE